ncbi:alpha/beta hydrolase [Stigmatella sp. ncwal1]|uniref:Alpha/beta hydrolase n=1 Tax=Stigmatella ashevillensis TaxID=2995309 RepID=A0ABT5D710_9BACT|nr:alpha/beta hydrolase [Stigmatella ashevillena]MDC0709452.1 alpha/beta hydrolase [Stigmatella ashevillena]
MTKTVVFVHGAWMSPLCWEHFSKRYEAAGYRCLAPAWPGDERPVPELQQAPLPELAELSVGKIVGHYERIIRALPEPPILIGHSFGGLFVQMLLDRGLGAAGVAIDPGPSQGVIPGPVALWAALPVFLSPFSWRRTVRMSRRSFAWGFAQELSPAEQRAAYDRYVVPTPGRIYYQAALGIGTRVDYANSNRAPLLLTAGEKDRTAETRMVRSAYRKYQRSSAVTAFKVFPGRTHWLIASPGWEEVADYAITWAREHARQESRPALLHGS